MSLFRDIKRIYRDGLKLVWRNPFVSFASVVVISLSLFLISFTLIFYGVLESSLAKIEQRVDVKFYLLPDTPKPELDEFISRLSAIDGIEEVRAISKEEALARFLKRYEKDQLIRRSIDELGENPLGPSVSVRAKDPRLYGKIVEEVQKRILPDFPYIDHVDYRDNEYIIQRLNLFSSIARKISYTLIAFFSALAVFIVLIFMGLVIYSAKTEIWVKRLVGAENRYISGPFAVAGVVYGFLSAIIVTLSIFPTSSWIGELTGSFFGDMNLAKYVYSNWVPLTVFILSMGMMLGYVASMLVVRRYLRK